MLVIPLVFHAADFHLHRCNTTLGSFCMALETCQNHTFHMRQMELLFVNADGSGGVGGAWMYITGMKKLAVKMKII